MKIYWLDLREHYDKKFLTAGIEAGATAVLAPEGKTNEIKRLGKIAVIAKDGDMKMGKDVDLVRITKKADEDEVVKYQGKIPVIVENVDWTIIPLENLISKTHNLIQSVDSPKEAELALQTMERGADGIILRPKSVNDIKEVGQIVESMSAPDFSLEVVKIIETKAVSMSDRVCVDTTSLLEPGSGLLVGNSASSMFLVHNENVESPFCAARPFRVNAGAVHAYVKLPNNKTKYLSELESGDEVLVIDYKGKSRIVSVGRSKIERRPMIKVVAENQKKEKISLILQNAETIRLITPKGKPLSVTTMKVGDEEMAYFGAKVGRHFGEEIQESIKEK